MAEVTKAEISNLFTMTPTAALAWLEKKGLRISADAGAMSADEQAIGFSFANLSRLDIAQDIVNGLKDALEKGQTQQQFIKNLEPVLRAKGWWGTKEEIDTDTGEIKKIKMGSPARLGTIYRTNIFAAYNAGRYQSMLANAKNRPYWKYTAVMDMNTRPSHAALNDHVFRYDDPIWEILFPPNGFNCRCRVEALRASEVEAGGYTIYRTERVVSQKITGPADENGNKTVTTIRGIEFKEGDKIVSFYPDAGFDTNAARAVYQANPDTYAVELARPYTSAGLASPQMEQLYQAKGTGETLPAAVIDLAGQALYEIGARTVWFTEPAITAQRLAGTLPALPMMPTAQLVIEAPALTIRLDGSLVFFRKINGLWCRAIVNPVSLAIESYTVVTAAELESAQQNGEILYGE